MTQLVFIHGPGAGACAEGFAHQLDHFPGSLAPTLPGHLSGAGCSSVERYTDWLRGWLWSRDCHQGLVLVGFTLGACIALQYALDYPAEVKGLVLMTVSMRPKERGQGTRELRQRASEDPTVYQEWWESQRRGMTFVGRRPFSRGRAAT